MPILAFAFFEVLGATFYVKMLRAARHAFGNKSSARIAFTSLWLVAERACARDWGYFNRDYRQSERYYDKPTRELYKGNVPLVSHVTLASLLSVVSAAVAITVVARSGPTELIHHTTKSVVEFGQPDDQMIWWGALAFLSVCYFSGSLALWRKVKRDLTMYEDSSVEQKGSSYRDAQETLDPDRYPRTPTSPSARETPRGRMTRDFSPLAHQEMELTRTKSQRSKTRTRSRSFGDLRKKMTAAANNVEEQIKKSISTNHPGAKRL